MGYNQQHGGVMHPDMKQSYFLPPIPIILESFISLIQQQFYSKVDVTLTRNYCEN